MFEGGDGDNGYYYSEEMDFGGEYESVRRPARKAKNPLYYFRRLFADGESGTVVHETAKAVLFEVDDGRRFWVPKKLLRENRTLVHVSFNRSYIKKEK